MNMPLDRKVNNQDVTYFLDLHRYGQLDLNPPFQRRSVWTLTDRRYFLDTIFRGYPSPSIYLSKDVNEAGNAVFRVVDGKQRLETILMFARDTIVLREFGDTSVDGRKWSEIKTNSELARRFLDYVLPVEQLSVGDDLNEVFDRLNRNNKNLNRQELRHAKYDGWFLRFVEREAEAPLWQKLGVVTAGKARRMADAQFISELLLVAIIQEIRGFSQDEIDDYTAMYQDPSNPESDVDRSTDDVGASFDRARTYLQEMAASARLIDYTKEARHMYSLWTVISLTDPLPAPADLTDLYLAFMGRVADLGAQDLPDNLDEEEATPELRYYSNSRGASTELRQRRNRHEILVAMIQEGS